MLINNITHILHKNGIKNVCISPGLRNTAISLPFIKHGKFNCHSILDERTAAYFALGMALKTNTASVLICTSGTATANYLPAIIEASQNKIPMLIITADRPSHLLNIGENQTIKQNDIYGNFVRDSLDFHEHDDAINTIQDSLKFIVAKCESKTSGPIHFNIHLDEFENFNKQKKYSKLPKPFSNKLKTNYSWDQIPYQDIFNIYNYEKPLIIIGRLNNKLDLKLITKLSNHLKAPILTDSLSQIRFNSNTLNLYEHYIGRDDIKPDLIIRIGQKPVSKKLCKKISDLKIQNTNPLEFSYLLIDESGRFNDDATTVIKTNYKQFIRFIVKNTEKNKNSDFYNHLHCLEEKVSTIIKNEKEWSELIISKHTLLSIKSKENFVIGNSMPIRYIDMLGDLNVKNINTYSNRGASGIDGIIATALGISYSSKNKTTLLIGDLSFIYDHSSLLVAKQLKLNLMIIIINNNGGGIFSLLPVSKTFDKKTFNHYWTTPQNINLKKIADLYDCNYQKSTSINELNSAILKYKNQIGIHLIDAQIDIQKNKKTLARIKKQIKKG